MPNEGKSLFVSYNQNDADIAEKFLIFFEKIGILDEDIYQFSLNETSFDLGSDWASGIVESISDSKVFVVLYSQHFRYSHICQKELGMAIAFQKTIVWISIDGSLPNDPYLTSLQAIVKPEHYPKLVDTLIEKLELKPLSATKSNAATKVLNDALGDRAGKQHKRILRRGELIDDVNIIDATFFLANNDIFDPVSKITEMITERQPMPENIQYRTPTGAQRWIDLCMDTEYGTFTSSLDFISKNADEILDVIGGNVVENSPDFISLGPGDGRKDRYLIKSLIARSNANQKLPTEVFYYPYDLSIDLLRQSIREVCRSDLNRQHLKIKAICADFSDAYDFKPVFDFRPQPNIFSLLGNTLGNMPSELNFLQSLLPVMNVEDFLILEVRLVEGIGEADPGGSEERRKKFNFAPLEQLGIKYSSDKMKYSRSRVPISQIPNTQTIVGKYGPFQLNKADYTAQLCAINHYNIENLKNALEGIGFIIEQDFKAPDESVGILILRKELGLQG